MIIRDRLKVRSPLPEVWDVIQDIPKIGSCVPGLENLEPRDQDNFSGTLQLRVGPLRARFRGDVRVTEKVPPQKITALVEGSDQATSSRVTATFTASLSPDGPDTLIDYEIDLNLRGRLATFGHPVILATAKKISAEFGVCLQELIAT